MYTSSNINRVLVIYEIFGLFIAIILGWSMPATFSQSWQSWTVTWIVVSGVVHLRIRYLSGDRDVLSPDKLFICAYFFFHYDYLLAYLLGIAKYSERVFAFPAYANLTTYLISLCLFFFIVGYNLKVRNKNPKSLNGDKTIYLNLDGKTLFAGKAMILIGFIFVSIFIFQLGLSNLMSRSYGFNLFYSGDYDYSFFSQGKSIMAVGIIFLLLDWFQPQRASRNKNLINLSLLTVVAIYMNTIFFLFSVRSWLLLDVFFPALLIYHYFYRKVSTKFLLIAFLIMLVASIFVEISRTSTTRTLSGFIDQFDANRVSKQYEFSDLITTQWRTYKNVNKSIALIDTDGGWFYGRTLLGGLFDSLPFAGKYLNKGWYESPSVWLARNMEPWFYLNHEGIGFSLPAEMYINFGLLGAAFIFLCMGWLCRQIYVRSSSLMSILLYVTFIPNLMFSIRQTVSSFIRPVFIALILTLLIQYTSKMMKGRR